MHPRTPLSSKQSKNFREKKRIQFAAKLILGVVVGGLFLFLVSYMSSVSALTITDIEVIGLDKEHVPQFRAAALKSLEGKYLGLFSRSNTFLFPHEELYALARAYPETDAVTFQRSGFDRVIATITEKEQHALVCTTLPDFTGALLSPDPEGACYFSDATGFIFKQAPSFSDTVYRRFYFPDLVVTPSREGGVGVFATSTTEFERITSVHEALSAHGIVVEATLSKGNNEYELYAHNPAPDASIVVVYFNTTVSTAEQVSNLISFWDHAVAAARAKGESVSFESIDVRYGAYVFYR